MSLVRRGLWTARRLVGLAWQPCKLIAPLTVCNTLTCDALPTCILTEDGD
jgi:hypothetical protein